MTTVCVGCGLDVDEDGKLIVQLDPGTPCTPNSLECSETGLTARQKRKFLRRAFTADGSASEATDAGYAVSRNMDLYTPVDDTGTAAGLWTVQGDGSILINCEGVYLVAQQTTIFGSTGQVIGGRARVFDGSGIIASSEINDRNNAIDLADEDDGPEFNASNVRHLAVGAVVSYAANGYTAVLGQTMDWGGEFTITYLGEFL